MATRRRPTATSSFGVSRRESHDASAFYARFKLPEVSADDTVNVNPDDVLDRVYCSDSRAMDALRDDSVALVVTSPPYFAGKEYEQALGRGHVPATYLDYLEMLTDVFAECRRKLEPGGRIAVNVANLGRKPYRSLAADVVDILQDRLGLLLRGEIVWIKGQGASGSCAWGSFRSAANPVLRDLTERVVVASKGRFDRSLSRRVRAQRGLPHESSVTTDEFMEATVDAWSIPAESASRVGHPAPFPVELPQRLIQLYTYVGDVVVDPFAGSGSTAVAAVRTGRRFVCYDTDPGYARRAAERVDDERALAAHRPPAPAGRAIDAARALLHECGFTSVSDRPRGTDVDLAARDRAGRLWLFDVCGAFTTPAGGLRRADELWRALGKASVLAAGTSEDFRLVLLTTALPARTSPGARALRAVVGHTVHDALDIASPGTRPRLESYARGEQRDAAAVFLVLPVE